MKTILAFVAILMFAVSGFSDVWAQADSTEAIDLWPEIEPFKTDSLRVSDLHQLYYELCGNPDGKPVLVLHGGPGSGCSPYYRRFFNPEKYLIVLHDQRGAGKSKPFAEIRENTTQNLVQDIERLRKHLKLDEMILFGGSWGTTLGLAYAEEYPEHVSGLVLRGVFTATKEEIDYFYHGGVRPFFPELYDSLFGELQAQDTRPLPEILFDLIRSDNPDTRQKYSKIWTHYEYKIAALETTDEFIRQYLQADDVMDHIYAFALLENYYMTNHCFLEEGQLLRDAYKIKGIPTIIINGRYDMVCPPITAYRLHQALPSSKLVIAEGAGHWMGDKPVERAMLQAMREME